MPAGVIERISEVRLSEVVSALSFALDITEGQPEGHAARSCLIGMRLAREIGLPARERSALFYALLMKDLGCSSNAAKVCYLFGADDRTAKKNLKLIDWTHFPDALRYIIWNVGRHGSMWDRLARVAQVAKAGQRGAKELVQIRCDRGATIARKLGFPEATAAAIRSLDEHWNGRGHPDGLRKEEIPFLARVLSIAQTVEVFYSQHGIEAAFDVARQRKGSWFDPELVRALMALRNDTAFWSTLQSTTLTQEVSKVEPPDFVARADERQLDEVAEGFGQVIDAKSPWTFRHSEGVAHVAVGIAGELGFDSRQLRDLRRAALLHDIGKLGVSNLILDKPGKLTPEEIAQMRKHPLYTKQILDRVAGFASISDLAASHHERLDGKGYYRGLSAGELSPAVRVLAVADMYEALAAKRPYRQDLSDEQVMDILIKNSGAGICPDAFAALRSFLNKSGFTPIKLAA
jgi:putative nucleotidyltransferase with HDIG domain